MIRPTIKTTRGKPLSKNESEELKFDLYLENRKIEEISKILEKVLLWPNPTKKRWAKKFSLEMTEMLDILLDEAMSNFNGTTLDHDMMIDFAEFTENLKNVARQVQSVTEANQPISA